MVGTFPGNVLWFSVFVGWICKVLIVRFGGASMYARSKPFFVGLPVGEAVAAGFWLLLNMTLALLGHSYYAVQVMPG
jgi:hypothetical protein